MDGSEITAHFGKLAVGCVALFIALRLAPLQMRGLPRSLLIGAVLGLLAGALILAPVSGPQGATLDARAGPALLAGFIGGPVAAFVTALLGGGARMIVGGPFAPSAVACFALYCAAGWGLGRATRRGDHFQLTWTQIAVLAAASVPLAASAALVIRPSEKALWWLREVYPAVALFNIAAVVFVAGVLREVLGMLTANARLRSLQRQLEAALAGEREANAVKSRLLANMSHEFRTPLNAIIGLSALLQQPNGADRLERNAAEINASGLHLLDLVENLLDFGAAEQGDARLPLETLDVKAALTRAINTVRPLAQDKGVTLTLTVPPDLRAQGASRATHQCLLNLLSNAVRHAPSGGVVSVAGERGDDGAVRLRVRNDGGWMAPGLIARVGEPFLRRDDEAGAERRGGLGLAITQALMARQGGALILRNHAGPAVEAELALPMDARQPAAALPAAAL